MAIAIAMTLLGIASLSRLAIEQYPDITPPVVQVSASYVGADAVTVNNSVAVPIAEQVMGTSDMLYMQTTSANDGTTIMPESARTTASVAPTAIAESSTIERRC